MRRSIAEAAPKPASERAADVLRVTGLSVGVGARRARLRIVDDVSLTVGHGEWVGLVGESGSGKSLTALSIADLLPDGGRVLSGTVEIAGQDLYGLSPDERQALHGGTVGFVFQDPSASLNPLMTIGDQVTEAIRVQRRLERGAARRGAEEALGLVRIPNPARLMDEYPHRLSGGMRQRVMIAIAIANEPALLIADEPTTALDVTIQAQILELLHSLRERLDLGILLITHDFAIVAQNCDRAYVMYAGQIVEHGSVEAVFRAPANPYSEALLRSTLDVSRPLEIAAIDGQPPSHADLPAGCRFRPRCRSAFARCEEEPPLFNLGANRRSRCWLREEEAGG
jgi:oligopeptide/dipeptide ABC transporter ATP-binding protein